MKFLLGKKKEMTQIFDEKGRVSAGTVVSISPLIVTQVKGEKTDGYFAVQLGGFPGKKAANKAMKGHLKELPNFSELIEVRLAAESTMQVGDEVTLANFTVGDKLEISGISKGKGFQGVIKRHGFAGGPRTHGNAHAEREPGSIAMYDSGENNNGKPVKEKYLDQVKYIDSEIKKITDDLIAKDPNAVIVLQSDEGIYPYAILQDEPYQGDPKRSSPNMIDWSDRYLRAKFGILAAYRLPGVAQDDIDKYANSVNIFKLVLNQYFGANLPYDPVCHIGLTDRSKYYSFTDLTKRLTGTENPACASK
jgi:large subunit ribosomal protein L3